MSKRFLLSIDLNDGGMRNRVEIGLALSDLAKELPRANPYEARVGESGEIAENADGIVVGHWEIVETPVPSTLPIDLAVAIERAISGVAVPGEMRDVRALISRSRVAAGAVDTRIVDPEG